MSLLCPHSGLKTQEHFAPFRDTPTCLPFTSRYHMGPVGNQGAPSHTCASTHTNTYRQTYKNTHRAHSLPDPGKYRGRMGAHTQAHAGTCRCATGPGPRHPGSSMGLGHLLPWAPGLKRLGQVQGCLPWLQSSGKGGNSTQDRALPCLCQPFLLSQFPQTSSRKPSPITFSLC